MNAYFFKMTNEERTNILDQHKEMYNGFATNNVTSNMQPLYVQDFANDKGGVTVNNRGEVTNYKNVGINEDVMSGSEVIPTETFEGDDEYFMSLGEKLDMIGDGDDDLENGTVDLDDQSNFELLMSPEMGDMGVEVDDMDIDNEVDFEEMLFGDNDFDDEEKGEIAFQIKESLDMFNRIKKVL
jgi:hypothetical protein